MQHRSTHAFSLVELSIVLVILGLLVGGILAGQSLIRAAELRSVTEEYTRYMTATHAFKDRYFALPGDIATATSFWGAADASPTTCATTDASGGTATCNGNGDGGISIYDSSQTVWQESFLFYKHLANAGLIQGQYAGIYYPTGQRIRLNGNVPASKLSQAFFLMVNTNTAGGWYPASGNLFYYGIRSDWSGVPVGAMLKPEEAWNIDTKFDDATPGNGRVIAPHSCGTTTVASTAVYNLALSTNQCNFLFRTGL